MIVLQNHIKKCIALGIVADSPQAGEPASLPRTMSGKPDGELASRNAQRIKEVFIGNLTMIIYIKNNKILLFKQKNYLSLRFEFL